MTVCLRPFSCCLFCFENCIFELFSPDSSLYAAIQVHYVDKGRFRNGKFEVRYGSELSGKVLDGNTATLAFNEYLVGLAWCHGPSKAGSRATFTTNLGRSLVFAQSSSHGAEVVCFSTSTFGTTARHQ